MKKLILLLCLMGWSTTAWAQTQYPLLDAFQLRVKKYEKVFEHAYNIDQIESAFKKFTLDLETELSLISKELIRTLPAEKRNSVILAQRAWEKYLERNLDLLDKIYSQGHGFSIDLATAHTAMIMQRIEELYILLQDYENSQGR